MQMARYPVGVYPGWLRMVLTWIIPVGLMTTLPAQALTAGVPFLWAAGSVALAAGSSPARPGCFAAACAAMPAHRASTATTRDRHYDRRCGCKGARPLRREISPLSPDCEEERAMTHTECTSMTSSPTLPASAGTRSTMMKAYIMVLPRASVTGVTVAWMATPDAIDRAGRSGHELLLAHESLYYPYDAAVGAPAPPGWQDWPVNRQRRELLDRHNLTFLRVHGSLDEICIFDDFAALLGLGQPVVAGGPYLKVYEVGPCTSGRAGRPGERLSRHEVRARQPAARRLPDRLVSRVGLPWGGMGLFVNVSYQQELIEAGCDVFIAGETDNYGFRFAQEAGISMIETSHELSENPGLRHFAVMLAQAFPALDVRFVELPNVWETR